MALTPIQIIRLTVQDSTPGLYIISDDEIQYFLDKNENNINRTALECARVILFNLSMRGDHTIDVLSIRGSSAAEQYRKSLVLFIKSPELNPLLQNTSIYAGGISLSDMQSNVDNADNNSVLAPSTSSFQGSYPSGYFSA